MILPFSSPFYHSKKNEAWLVMANRRKTNCGMIEVEVEDTVGEFKVEYKDPLDCFPKTCQHALLPPKLMLMMALNALAMGLFSGSREVVEDQ